MALEFMLDNGIPTYKVKGEVGRRKMYETAAAIPASSGGAVTQQTNRATGVTINALTGVITTHNASLAAEASAVFVVTNSQVRVGDVPVLAIRSGAVALNTDVVVAAVASGSFSIKVINNNVAAGTAETGAILINFIILKSVQPHA
jgi:hypothetical protein